jgi:hypothetical protein
MAPSDLPHDLRESAMIRLLTFFFDPVFLLLVAGLGGALPCPRSAITRENAAKIAKGMTPAQVEAILGGQARNESTGPSEREDGAPYLDELFTSFYLGETMRVCQSDNVRIRVYFQEGKVAYSHSYNLRATDRGVLAIVRRLHRVP